MTAVFPPFRLAVIIVYYNFQKIIHPKTPLPPARTPIFSPLKTSLENTLVTVCPFISVNASHCSTHMQRGAVDVCHEAERLADDLLLLRVKVLVEVVLAPHDGQRHWQWVQQVLVLGNRGIAVRKLSLSTYTPQQN